MSAKKVFHWIFYLIAVAGIFVSEKYYNRYLFELSIPFIKELQGYTSQPIITSFFKLTTLLGGRLVLIKVFVTILFFPIHKAFMLIFILAHCAVLEGVLQIVYHEPRPFYIDPNISPNLCVGDYGNPSGHGVQSVSVYLSFWHLATDDIKLRDKNIFRLFTLFGYFVMIIFILFSRLILGVQTLNQLLYGVCIGFAFYYLFFILLDYHKHTGETFFTEMQSPAHKSFYSLLMILSTGALIFVFVYYRKLDNTIWVQVLQQKCPEIIENQMFNNQAFIYGLKYFMFIGTYAGIQLLTQASKEKYLGDMSFRWNEINDWNVTGFTNGFLRTIFIISISAIPISAQIFIPISYNYWLIVALKFILPYFIMFILIFSIGIHFSIGLGIANPEIGKTKNKYAVNLDLDDSNENENEEEKILMI